MNPRIPIALALAATAAFGAAGTQAFIDARIIDPGKPSIERGTILVRGGRIERRIRDHPIQGLRRNQIGLPGVVVIRVFPPFARCVK